MPEKYKDSNALAVLSRQIRSQPIDYSKETKKRKLLAKPTSPPLPVAHPASSDLLSTAIQDASAALATSSTDTKQLQHHLINLQHHASHHFKSYFFSFQPESYNSHHPSLHTDLSLLITHLKAALLVEQQQHSTNHDTATINQEKLIDWHLSQMATDYEADLAAVIGDGHDDDDDGSGEYREVFMRILRSGVNVYSDKEKRVILDSCL